MYETRYVSELVSKLADARAQLVDDRGDKGVSLDDEKRFAAS